MTDSREVRLKTCFVYTFLDPPPELFDDRKMDVICKFPVQMKDGSVWDAAILGTQHTVHAVRIAIPNVPDRHLSVEHQAKYDKLRDFFLDCIRIGWSPTADYFRYGDAIMRAWDFHDPGEGPGLAIQISQPLNPDYRVNGEGLRLLMAAEPELRPIIHLLADGSDTRLPLQFRFLSFYKILELHYKISANKKFEAILQESLEYATTIYTGIKSTSQLREMLHKLRNRCAHIKIGTGEKGFSHFGVELSELAKAMPLIRRMAVRVIQVHYPNSHLKFAADEEERRREFEAMVVAGLQPYRIA